LLAGLFNGKEIEREYKREQDENNSCDDFESASVGFVALCVAFNPGTPNLFIDYGENNC
jgi:hypothetical protein